MMIYVARLIRVLFAIYSTLIFIRILFSWIRPNMFNPIVQYVYKLTDPYLKLFARIRFLKIGGLDFSAVAALFVLYFVMELSYNIVLTGLITPLSVLMVVIAVLFRFIYFILFIFIVAVALRCVFGLIPVRQNNMLVMIVNSISEVAVRPIRGLSDIRIVRGLDMASLISLIILILIRFFILPRLLRVLYSLISRGGV
jgi:YggT family protein